MEPIPETRSALEELGLTADDDLLASLLDAAERGAPSYRPASA